VTSVPPRRSAVSHTPRTAPLRVRPADGARDRAVRGPVDPGNRPARVARDGSGAASRRPGPGAESRRSTTVLAHRRDPLGARAPRLRARAASCGARVPGPSVPCRRPGSAPTGPAGCSAPPRATVRRSSTNPQPRRSPPAGSGGRPGHC